MLAGSRPTISEAREEHRDPATATEALLAVLVSGSTARSLVAITDCEARIYQAGAWPAVRLTHGPHNAFNLTCH